MNCIVTAGPTYEKLDDVRRLTNFSTGKLGSELANFLAARGHGVTLLLGEQATFRCAYKTREVLPFTTTADLRDRLNALSRGPVDAVFHAAAVSDYTFGRIWMCSSGGEMTEIKSGKISTRDGTLLAELVPTSKIISELRQWYPKALLVGWKFEVDGRKDEVLEKAERQIAQYQTSACVANGAAYGDGFGIVSGAGQCQHVENSEALFVALEEMVRNRGPIKRKDAEKTA
jgi:phosphopantothenoylcysteine synthetase/decarboxylase